MQPGDVVSYLEMCAEEGVSLQWGMNFQLRSGRTVILMSRRTGAPYRDRVEEDGRVLLYEGHDVPRSDSMSVPKVVDQVARSERGAPTQNGLFAEAAQGFQRGERGAERVRVYEKIRQGIWVFNGVSALVDATHAHDGTRRAFRFRLEAIDDEGRVVSTGSADHEPNRLIPTEVKLEVWKRDQGRCVQCGSADNLHFDHIIPFSRGGSSSTAANIQLLCARHNLAKRDRIQ